jgi:hypothetical protein
MSHEGVETSRLKVDLSDPFTHYALLSGLLALPQLSVHPQLLLALPQLSVHPQLLLALPQLSVHPQLLLALPQLSVHPQLLLALPQLSVHPLQVPDDAHIMDVVFNDGESSTFVDNNGGLDFHIPIEGGKGVMPGIKVRRGRGAG